LLIRACYRDIRRGRNRWTIEVDVEGHETADADATLDIADRDQLERGFRRLDSDQRMVLVLHYYLGLSLDEAAEALGIPPGTVRSRLSRATRAMRAALDADGRLPILNERRST
jgi:RNA polymerase sigma factor (sigma-70 family)